MARERHEHNDGGRNRSHKLHNDFDVRYTNILNYDCFTPQSFARNYRMSIRWFKMLPSNISLCISTTTMHAIH